MSSLAWPSSFMMALSQCATLMGSGFGEQLFFFVDFPDDPLCHHVCAQLFSCLHASPGRRVVARFLRHLLREHLVDVFCYLGVRFVVS